MFTAEITTRVRYGETDQMGYAYYGNYAVWCEMGRVETLRKLGISYRDLEKRGIMLPVLDFKIRYFKPAYYDDTLHIKTTIPEMPGVRIRFTYSILNADGDLLSEAETTLVFTDAHTRKPIPPDKDILLALQPFFKES
jgi:acyl-CoA thioester hydrolase